MKYLFDELESVCLIETYIINYYELDKNIKKQNIELLSKKLNLYGRYKYPDRVFDDKYRNVNGMDMQLNIVIAKLLGKYKEFSHSRIIEDSVDNLLFKTSYFIEKFEEFYKYDYSSIGIGKEQIEQSKNLINKFVNENYKRLNLDMSEEKKIEWSEDEFDVSFSKPIRLVFKQVEIEIKNSWRSLYYELICYLLKNPNYSERLLAYKDKSFFGAKRDLFNSFERIEKEKNELNNSIDKSYELIDSDLYLYVCLSAYNIIKRIFKVLEILSINANHVEIYYVNKNCLEEGSRCNLIENNTYIEKEEYDIDDKKFNNYKQLKDKYANVVDPIIVFNFDDNKLMYNVRTNNGTYFLYKFTDKSYETESTGNEFENIKNLLNIIKDRNLLKKESLYYQDGYIVQNKKIEKEKFEEHIKELYFDCYGITINKYDEHLKNIMEILKNNFTNGFRLNDEIELKKFQNEYENLFEEMFEIEKSKDEFYEYLKIKFINLDDVIYVQENLITSEIKLKVDNFIGEIFEESILIPRIDNEKEFLLTLDYFIKENNLMIYISKEKLIKCIQKGLLNCDNYGINICYLKDNGIYLKIDFEIFEKREIKNKLGRNEFYEFIDKIIARYLEKEGICISYKEICDKLSFIDKDDIKNVVKLKYTNSDRNMRSKEIIYDETGVNTTDELKKLFHISAFPFNLEECKSINDLLKEKEIEGWEPIDLKKIIKKEFNAFSYKLDGEDFHDYAIKRCIEILLENNQYAKSLDAVESNVIKNEEI